MWATSPATGAAHVFAHFVETDSDAARSRFGFLRILHPTNPLITREWCDVEPQRRCFRIGLDSGSEIFWKSVY